MRLLLNLLWFVLGGWISGTLWFLAGCLFAITVVGMPWVPAAWRIASFSYWPFGRRIVDHERAGAGSALLNILWLILAGWWLALAHIAIAVPQAITIIGIPFAWQHVKLAVLSLTPVGKVVVEA